MKTKAFGKKPEKVKSIEPLIVVNEIETSTADFNVVGLSPLIMHRYALKAWRELLYPGPKLNRAERQTTLKHQPLQEYRECLYLNRDDKRPSLFHIPNGMFHGALGAAAKDIPGASKAEIVRLTRVTDINIDLFGLPQLFMSMVRNRDMNRTPDVRTRPIFAHWACRVHFRYVAGLLTRPTIANLFGAAGLIVGIGDWRGEKGGPYGSFRLAEDDDKEFVNIVKTQGRKPQQQAFNTPAYFDEDTADLMRWFNTELVRREQKTPKPKRVVTVRGNGQGETYVGAEA